MKWIPIIILAVLHLTVGILNIKIGHIGPIVMAVGSLILLYGIYRSVKLNNFSTVLLIIGIILIIDSAIYNGFKLGNINWSHHIIRIILFTISFLLVYIKK